MMDILLHYSLESCSVIACRTSFGQFRLFQAIFQIVTKLLFSDIHKCKNVLIRKRSENYVINLASDWMCAMFTVNCMAPPCWCPCDEHQHGGQITKFEKNLQWSRILAKMSLTCIDVHLYTTLVRARVGNGKSDRNIALIWLLYVTWRLKSFLRYISVTKGWKLIIFGLGTR